MMMRIVKPINWNYIEDIRHGDWKLMKGDFGECIVREFLEGRGFELERLGRRARGLPDFKISGLPVMVEVKAHKDRRKNRDPPTPPSKPPVWQRKSFIPLRRLGWRILIAHPQIRKGDGERCIVCTGIEWYAFDGEGKLDRLPGFPEDLKCDAIIRPNSRTGSRVC